MNMIEISLNHRMPALEERTNIHPGSVYRVRISGMNPLEAVVFDGILTGVTAEQTEMGYRLKTIELCDGISYSTLQSPREDSLLFGKEVIHVTCESSLRFGRMLNEKGFYEMKQRISQKSSRE
ncbi:MAG: hypothetical protein WC916_03700 [Candidatus Woesearchaeota archaeon]